jgi:putative phage-type endonuclease
MAIVNIENDDHWHGLRSSAIGGSECGIVFGVSSYGTRNELFHVKRGTYKQDTEGSKLMQWGQLMEPVIGAVISGENHWDLVQCKEYHTHPEYPFLGATLDYHVVKSEHGPGLLEVKNVVNFSPGWGKEVAPAYIELQIQHQFLVVNAARKAEGLKPYKWGCIGSMHAGNPEDIRIMYRQPDPKVHEHIIKECSKFWKEVEENREPDLIGDKEYKHISEMFKQAEVIEDAELLDLRGDDSLDDIVSQYEESRIEAIRAKKRQDEAKAKIMKALMDISPEGATKALAAKTNTHGIEIKLINVVRKAQEEKTSTQLRFKVRGEK